MIEIQGLYKYYGQTRALGPVNVQIEAGQIVGLLGENGAGKTTALRILACDLLPSAGSVHLAGFDVVENPDEVRQQIGYLPDKPPLYPEMTVREYLSFAARLKGVSPRESGARVAEVAERTRLSERLDQVIGTLSHGFQQRVGIAQAIVHQPRFVVLDEPISGLDPRQIVEMRHLIRGLSGQHTVLISSHILSEISQTCDRLLVIRDGMIVADDTEHAIVNRTLGGMRLSLVVRGDDEEAALLALRQLDGVDIVSSEHASGQIRVEVYCATDKRGEISRKIVESQLELLELSRSERELEQVFMRLASEAEAKEAS